MSELVALLRSLDTACRVPAPTTPSPAAQSVLEAIESARAGFQRTLNFLLENEVERLPATEERIAAHIESLDPIRVPGAKENENAGRKTIKRQEKQVTHPHSSHLTFRAHSSSSKEHT